MSVTWIYLDTSRYIHITNMFYGTKGVIYYGGRGYLAGDYNMGLVVLLANDVAVA
jgi:hypothetical protein